MPNHNTEHLLFRWIVLKIVLWHICWWMEKLSETKPPLNPRMIYSKRYDLVLAIFKWTVSVLLFILLFANNLFFKQMSSRIIQKVMIFVATPVVIVCWYHFWRTILITFYAHFHVFFLFFYSRYFLNISAKHWCSKKNGTSERVWSLNSLWST